jgi:hypothetical protein
VKTSWAEYILRIGVFGEFLGHGILALQGKQAWIGWIEQLLGVDQASAAGLLFLVGLFDVIVAFIVLLRPVRCVLFWAALWGLWTALLRPLMGESLLDFIERWANWAAPLALLFLQGMPKHIKGWLTCSDR